MVMCFTKYLLEKKEPLSRIWLAAHWENKLKRSSIFEIDIERSIKYMISAEIILDLRISGHLLIGIVKIYSKKTQFLLNECNNVFYVVSAFHSDGIDLPDKKKEACMEEITLPENFVDLNISDDSDLITMLSMNQSCIEAITLKENVEPLININDELEGFEFDDDTGLDFIEDLHALSMYNEHKVNSVSPLDEGKYTLMKKETAVEHFEIPNNEDTNQRNDEGMNKQNDESTYQQNDEESSLQYDECHLLADDSLTDDNSLYSQTQLEKSDAIKDCLSLEPLKSACGKKLKRKRKLIIDPITYITYEKLQKHIFESSDLTEIIDFAPGTKRLMHLKQIGTSEQLFLLPSIKMGNRKILHLYQRNLKSHKSSETLEDSSEDETFRKYVMPKPKVSKCSVLFQSIRLDDGMESELDFDENSNDVLTSMEVQCSENYLFINDEEEKNHLKTCEFFHSPEEERTSKFAVLPEQDDVVSPVESDEVPDHWKQLLGKRLNEMYHSLQHYFSNEEAIDFSVLAKNKTKLKVAEMFFGLLMLKKLQIVDLVQTKPNGEMFIHCGKNFNYA